jgi:hypothetical protein
MHPNAHPPVDAAGSCGSWDGTSAVGGTVVGHYSTQMQSDTYAQTPTAPLTRPISIRQSMAHRPHVVRQHAPNWTVQTEHDHSSLRRPSRDQSSRNHMPNYFNSSQDAIVYSPTSLGPSNRRPSADLLRHRSSYDGHSDASRLRIAREHGPYPSNPRATGQEYVADTRSGFPGGQTRDQSGRYPPYVLRGHSRNRSTGSNGSNGNQVPYRILHSYNSPAYRHAPIWG